MLCSPHTVFVVVCSPTNGRRNIIELSSTETTGYSRLQHRPLKPLYLPASARIPQLYIR